MPEYRSLHFIREEEKEKEEGDSGENSGPGGEASGSGESTDGAPEAPEKVTYEYYSDYGYYKNADAGLASERTRQRFRTIIRSGTREILERMDRSVTPGGITPGMYGRIR